MTAAAFVEALGWTLLDFTWQGALIACATAIQLAMLRNARPQTRYALACTALLLCLLWPACSLIARLNGGAAAEGAIAVMLAGAGAAVASDLGWAGMLRLQLAWIVGAWALCALLLALRMVAGLLWVRRAALREALDPAWQARLDRLAPGFGIRRQVRLRLVEGLASPVTAGCWRPLVLVPAALVTGMPAHLLEALLAHELAHIRRHDYLVNLIQNMVEALLFYHPAVWWLSRSIRAERELIADAIAAGQLGEPRRLALALSELEKCQFSHHNLAQAANGGDLMSRITHLLRPETKTLSWKAALPVIGFALAALAGCAQQAQATPEQAAAITAPGVTVKADVLETAAVADFKSCSRPHYPAEALRRKIEGTVTLGFLVGANGSVRETTLRKSSGDNSLDDAARSALSKCSFRPATVNGAPVERWTEVQYVWKT